MAVGELPRRRAQTGEQATRERTYYASGYATEDAALAAVAAVAPAMIGNLHLQWLAAEDAGPSLYFVTAHYGIKKPKSIGEISVSFDYSLETVHVTHARQHLGDYAPPGKQPINYQGAINVRRDANGITVEGVDMLVPVQRMQFRMRVSGAALTWEYIRDVLRKAPCQNSEEFYGFEPGEVRWDGGSMVNTVAEEMIAEVSFNFSIERNATNLQIGNITIPFKRGWDYVWVEYADTEDGGWLLKEPIGAHHERLYPLCDFSDLLLGG